jgi:hypothetical protein
MFPIPTSLARAKKAIERLSSAAHDGEQRQRQTARHM